MAQEKWLVDGPTTIDLEQVRHLKIALVGGNVDVVAHDEPGARVEVHSVSGKELRISIDGDSLEIDHPQLSWDNWIEAFRSFSGKARADISVSVPRDVALKFGVVSASGLISGLVTDGSISTVSGDLVLDGVTGDVQLNAVSGEISVRDHTGDLVVHTISGDVTAQGDIARFAADSVSGDLFLDVTGSIADRVKANTVSGNVTARLNDDLPAQYTVNTVSGKLQLDNNHIQGVRGRYTGSYGKLERNFVEFQANTVSGDIIVLRAVRA